MLILRRYRRILDARAAALYLWRHGVVAMIHNPINDSKTFVPTFDAGEIEVLIADKRERELATALLEELTLPGDGEAEATDEDWEPASPDLSLLDAALAPICPSCKTVQPLDAAVSACAACRAELDVIELLIAKHGPDVLEPCYPDEPLDLEEHVLIAAPVPCDRCDYTFGSLPVQGLCPECGEPYDKQAYVRRCMG